MMTMQRLSGTTIMRKGFLKFLAAEGVIDPDRVRSFQETLRAAPEPLGVIAFRYGIITGGDIDDILDTQRHDDRPFGEIAVEKGLLTSQQVRTLLCVQQMRAATESAEALALAGVCPIEEMMTQLGRFLLTLHGTVLSVP
jgi:hypothetical protein